MTERTIRRIMEEKEKQHPRTMEQTMECTRIIEEAEEKLPKARHIHTYTKSTQNTN